MTNVIVESLRLGKRPHEHDARTLMLENFMRADISAPPLYDFDKNRKSFPIRPMGNDKWGNCVKVGEANQLMRLERVETRSTPGITDAHVIEAYKDECEVQFGKRPEKPGDSADTGLIVLYNIRNWRNTGWTISFGKRKKTYKISAFGELNPRDRQQMRAACYHLHGIQLGIWLPRSAIDQTGPEKVWDITEGSDTAPGSWGGHLVYAKKYQPDMWEVLTWGFRQLLTNEFLEKYTDEAWGVVDSLDSWRVKQGLDVEAMKAKLQSIASHVEG